MEPVDLFRCREESLHRVKTAWSQIIQKYSALSLEEQGDVVDIASGRIIEDSGHIRSLRPSVLWKVPDSEGNSVALGSGLSSKTRPSVVVISDDNLESEQERGGIIKRIDSAHDNSIIVGHRNYTVLSRYTRSRMVEGDNLKITPEPPKRIIVELTRVAPAPTSTDPLNILKKRPDLSSPYKVRRVRKAMLASRQRGKQLGAAQRTSRRQTVHKMVRQSIRRAR